MNRKLFLLRLDKMTRLFGPSAFLVFFLAPVLLAANGIPIGGGLWTNGTSVNADSIPAYRGLCTALTIVDPDCVTKTATLTAFQYDPLSGVYTPMLVTWSTGAIAHKITVVPPGTWSWDPTYQICGHHDTERTLGPFFDGVLDITGPSKFCLGIPSELNITNPYPFESIMWEPSSPDGSVSPYTLLAPEPTA